MVSCSINVKRDFCTRRGRNVLFSHVSKVIINNAFAILALSRSCLIRRLPYLYEISSARGGYMIRIAVHTDTGVELSDSVFDKNHLQHSNFCRFSEYRLYRDLMRKTIADKHGRRNRGGVRGTGNCHENCHVIDKKIIFWGLICASAKSFHLLIDNVFRI